MPTLSLPLLLIIVTVTFVIYTLYLLLTCLYLSPISHIPGPKVAIFSFWYEFYCNVILHGRYTWKIGELHKEYGPIVRINPYEVHINDPEFYDEVYVSGGKRKSEQWAWTVVCFLSSLKGWGNGWKYLVCVLGFEE